MSNPSIDHYKAIVRVLRYLKYTQNYSLYYIRYLVVLEGYNDANQIFDIKDSKSTSSYIFIIGRAVTSWKSSKQTVIAQHDPLWNLNLLLQINVEKKLNSYAISQRISLHGKNQCHQYAYTMIINQLLVGYKVKCIIVSLDIYVANMVLLNNYS